VAYIFRGGVPLAVPVDYATDPAHATLVAHLTRLTRYADAVAFLEVHPTDGYLAADVLNGALWAKRYLNASARFSAGPPKDRALALRGWRALMHVLNGTRPKVGRHREPPLTAEALGRAAASVARWRSVTDALWGQERATLATLLLQRAEGHFRVSAAHRRAVRALVRRKALRKRDVVLTFASWETGLALRRLRMATSVADLVYA
jgi:hypothetical protein